MFNGYRALSFCIPEPIFDIAILTSNYIGQVEHNFICVIFQCLLIQELATCSELEYGQHQISSYSDNTEEYRIDFYVFWK